MSVKDPYDEINQSFKDAEPVVTRFLNACWNLLMRIFEKIGLMPFLKKSGWRLFWLLLIISMVFPALALPILLISIVALNAEVRAKHNYMIGAVDEDSPYVEDEKGFFVPRDSLKK